jgi:hypothetical protein
VWQGWATISYILERREIPLSSGTQEFGSGKGAPKTHLFTRGSRQSPAVPPWLFWIHRLCLAPSAQVLWPLASSTSSPPSCHYSTPPSPVSRRESSHTLAESIARHWSRLARFASSRGASTSLVAVTVFGLPDLSPMLVKVAWEHHRRSMPATELDGMPLPSASPAPKALV